MAYSKSNQFHGRLLDKMLLHGQVTRRQIGEGFGISKVAASRHVDWMKEHGLTQSLTVRLPKIRRPVELLQVNDSLATAMAVRLSSHQIAVDIVGTSGKVLQSRRLPVENATQIDVLGAMRELTAWAKHQVAILHRRLDLVGLAVNGFLEPTSGMIFKVTDVLDWEPCHLGNVIEELSGIPCFPWTSVSCRLRGLSQRIGLDHRVGYISHVDHGLAVASLENGSIRMGRFGTSGGQVHHRVSESAARCICGRRGCLYDHLRAGDATAAMILDVLPRITTAINADVLGLEWPFGAADTAAVCPRLGARRLHRIQDGPALEQAGLHLACARAMLLEILAEKRPQIDRNIINHETFRSVTTTESALDPVTL